MRPFVSCRVCSHRRREHRAHGASSRRNPRAARAGRLRRSRHEHGGAAEADGRADSGAAARARPVYVSCAVSHRGVRLTNATDCVGGQDCVNYVGYSYWRNMNNHVGSDTMYRSSALDRRAGRRRPDAVQLQQAHGAVTKVGPLFDPASALQLGDRRGLVFQRHAAARAVSQRRAGAETLRRRDADDGNRVRRVHASGLFGANRFIWQVHSSNDDRVHSATVKDRSSYAALGCFAYPRGHEPVPSTIREDRRLRRVPDRQERPLAGDQGERRRRATARTTASSTCRRAPRRGLLDAERRRRPLRYRLRLHGRGRQLGQPGQRLKVWQFGQNPLQGALVYHNTRLGRRRRRIRESRERDGPAPARQQYACGSSANGANCRRANEIICFPLDGSMRMLIVAPVMTDLNAARRRRRLLEAAEGQPRRDRRVLHLDEQSGRQSARRVHRSRALAALTGEPPPTRHRRRCR